MDKPCARCGMTGIYGLSVLCKACYFENQVKEMGVKIKALKEFIKSMAAQFDVMNAKL